MQLSKDDAAAALAAVQQSSAAARSAFRAHRGHYHLWLWGVVWIAMSLVAHFGGERAMPLMPWVSGAGTLGSVLIGYLQNAQVRSRPDRRFFGVLATVIGFAALLPLMFHVSHVSSEMIFAYTALIVAQAYVISGLWFDTYLVWFGLLLAVLILLGLLVFVSIFWLWIAVCTGGAYIATGFYVRYFWR